MSSSAFRRLPVTAPAHLTSSASARRRPSCGLWSRDVLVSSSDLGVGTTGYPAGDKAILRPARVHAHLSVDLLHPNRPIISRCCSLPPTSNLSTIRPAAGYVLITDTSHSQRRHYRNTETARCGQRRRWSDRWSAVVIDDMRTMVDSDETSEPL